MTGPRRLPAVPLLVVSLLLISSLAAAQNGARPDELWTFEAGGPANDVAVDADGKIVAAVQGDANAAPTADDDEVFAWDLDRAKTSSSPVMRGDPSEGLGAPEGLQVLALEPRPGGKGDFLAVANEGSSDQAANNVYVYRRSSGGASETRAGYEADDGAPDGAVEDLWFLDRNSLLVYHADALSLLERRRGTEYVEGADGRWSPPDGETIRDVDANPGRSRVAVVTSENPDGVGNVTLTLRVLEADNGTLDLLTVPWTKSRPDPGAQLDLSDDGEFLLLGSAGKTLFYLGLHPNENATGEDPERVFSEFPWTRNGPDDVTGVALSPRGNWLAAGFANGRLVVYERVNASPEGPRAERAVDRPIATGQPPTELSFADGNRSLFVRAAGLMAFDRRQFERPGEVTPLWTLPGATGFAVSRDGGRLAVTGTADSGGVVSAHEQRYAVQLEVDAPETVEPGRAANLSVDLANNGSAFDAYDVDVAGLPSSWSVQGPDEPVALLPGERGNATLSLTPSATESPGEVSFRATADSRRAPGHPTLARQSASTTVETVHAAGLTVDESQRAIDQGATVDLAPSIRNGGNTREPILLRVTQDDDWTVEIEGERTDRSSFELAPQASRDVSVEVTAPGDGARGDQNTIELTARPEDGGASATASVPLVVDPSYGARFEVPDDPVEVSPGERVETDVTVVNDGNTEDTYTLEVTSNASNPQHLWGASLSTGKVTLEDEGEETVTVAVEVPRGAAEGDAATVTLQATSEATGEQVGEASYELVFPETTEDSPAAPAAGLLAAVLAALAAGRRER